MSATRLRRARQPDARELEESVGGEPRNGRSREEKELVGALHGCGRLGDVPSPGGVPRSDCFEQERDEGRDRVDRRDRGRLVGERLGIGPLVLLGGEQRAETEAEGRQLGCPGRGGELDRQHELALRACGVAGEEQGGGACEDGGRAPGVPGEERLVRGVGVIEHLVGAVAAAEPSQEEEARIAVAESAHRGIGPMLRVAGSSTQAVQPGRGDAEVGMVLHVVLGHEVEPAFERVEPAASTSRHGEAVGEIRDAADVARRCRMLESLLDCPDLEGPDCGGTVQCARLFRLGSLELPREEVADDAWVAVAAPAVVEGDGHAGVFEGLEHLCRVGPSEE
jgi:hypothetical protein